MPKISDSEICWRHASNCKFRSTNELMTGTTGITGSFTKISARQVKWENFIL